jgi:hypothetical protein
VSSQLLRLRAGSSGSSFLKDFSMSATPADNDKPQYTTPRWVQAWFLRRSRDNWKNKYVKLKADAKRFQNRVNDVSKSREHWRAETRLLGQRVRELEAENSALREQLAAGKKAGPPGAAGPR